MKGKRIQFDDETWVVLDLLARDRMMNFQELADEVFGEQDCRNDRDISSPPKTLVSNFG